MSLRAAGPRPVSSAVSSGSHPETERSVMNVLDLIKATIACGGSAFLIYSFPVIGQVVIIGGLSLLWLGYAHRTLSALRRK